VCLACLPRVVRASLIITSALGVSTQHAEGTT